MRVLPSDTDSGTTGKTLIDPRPPGHISFLMTNLRVQELDDFLPDPLAYRAEAVQEKFYDIRGPDGELYKNINVRPSHEFDALISERLGRPAKAGYSLLRVNFDGEMPNNAVHSDNSYDQFAAVLYLNPPEQCKGGTAFWRYKKYGWTHWPTDEQVRRTCRKSSKVMRELHESYNNLDAWEQVHLAEMKFNRMILYPTTAFHSRWPWAAWGKTMNDARLIWVSFFNA